ncbi:glucose-6-phosphate dehydrogenase assembly protein OpcA [Gandjariella thermophila]|uniref:Glucose-6-phosphate dehydrogenase assembly protein OpcA n=1 Tax=Gandjariella thermophila TaxID=1931992 RepID=A0A4D4J0M5_9PSEU|nr:glucose-6-phosphate dehydrogenase assembly protein OpcA [Gandjariella thermophila]GDY28914.1 glucose-6-phosphate dehydrogenase assembly protein OpcA [Gandjariella thermophila]
MILDLPSTTTSQVNRKLVELRESGGAVALGRVLTLVIVTDDGFRTEEAIDAANDASREHPCRVIVVARGTKKAAPRLDAQIRVGGDAGASEVIVLRLYGPLADEGASCVVPLLLPDAPVVAWWPFDGPSVPSQDPIGQLATRRITDSAAERNPIKALEQRRKSYAEGDTDLAWTRLTTWRAVLAAALDLPPHDRVTGASVTGEADSPSTDLLAAWLATCLGIRVSRAKATFGEGIVTVRLERKSGPIELVRPDGRIGTLTQPGQPDRRVALQRRQVRDCLAEELRRLEPDVIYETTLQGLGRVVRARASASRSTAKAAEKSTGSGGSDPKTAARNPAESTGQSTGRTTAGAAAKSGAEPGKGGKKNGGKTKPKAKAKVAGKSANRSEASSSAGADAAQANGRHPAPKPARRASRRLAESEAGATS